MLSRAAFEGNFYPQAIQPLERVLGRNDAVSQAFADSGRIMIAKSYYAAKDYAKAREAYGLVKPAALNQEATKLYVSSILLSGGDTLKAVDMYKRVVDANPTDCDLSGGLGSLLYSMKRYDDVIQVFTNRITNCPAQSPSSAYLFIGLSHFAKNRIDEAVDALNKAVASDTSSVQAHFWLMNAYAKKDNFAKAGEVGRLMASRGMDKSNPKEVATGYFFAGTEKFKAKDYKGAIAEYDRAMKLNPESAQAYLYTAFSYQYQSDKDNACKYYNLALKYDPKNADVRKNMKTIGCE
jgi:Tfp pilus assembly protein PilF